jgi:D-glycero-D-manno-heptose 1,7-bisphosphate phosphatase
MNKLIILDRDGVINQDSDAYVKTVDEWIEIPGSAKAIADLYKAGFQIAVATNQSGIARNYFTEETLAAMHNKMTALVEEQGGKFSTITYCPHGPEDNCDCRKPLAGLITLIEQHLNVSAEGAYLVGDSLRDLQAGVTKGCKPVLVMTGKGEKTLLKILTSEDESTEDLAIKQAPVYTDLAHFARTIIG